MSAPLLCLCLFLTNPRLKNPMLTECESDLAKTGDQLQGCASLLKGLACPLRWRTAIANGKILQEYTRIEARCYVTTDSPHPMPQLPNLCSHGRVEFLINNSLIDCSLHPNTRALTSILSLSLAPSDVLGSTKEVCGALPFCVESKHSSSNLSLFSIPDQ